MALKKLTLAEIDGILQRATARRLHAELHIPDADNILFKKDQVQLSLGHLSDKRDGTHVRKSFYGPATASVSKEYYPVGTDANLLDSGVLGSAVNNATTRDGDIQPAAGTLYEIHSIRLIASAFAAGRTATLNWYDGTNTVPIWVSGAGGIASASDYLIYPVDLSGLMTGGAALIGSPPLKLINTQYIRFSNTDLAAAETLTIRFRFDVKSIGGLRQ